MSEQQIYIARTSPSRTAKMMAIMLGICIAGGAIFFGLWDYWISETPPVVGVMREAAERELGTFTGVIHTIDLAFVASGDFRDLSFNELLGSPGANPTITVEIGDKLVFNLVNDADAFYAFGVTAADTGVGDIFTGSEIGTPESPLKPGQTGTSQFIPPENGTYYYISTFPGHREQGMVGEIIVTVPPSDEPVVVIRNIDLAFVASGDFRDLSFNALLGEPGANPTITAEVGDKLVFNLVNDADAFYAFGVTAADTGVGDIFPGSEIGTPESPLKPGQMGTSQFTPTESGTYYYISTFPGHREQGMVGEIIVTAPPKDDEKEPEIEVEVTPAVSHNFTLDFYEADDFRTFAFVAKPGEEGANPEIRVAAGDQVTVSSTNQGISFHSFAVVSDPTNAASILWDSEIGSAAAALTRGQTGEVTFVADTPGVYYYICTVPGHALQGMQGSFIVE